MGCGGFIRSGVEINYSRVEVKLLTRQGSHKYQTEGAPNNGYYLIPLYDRGDYTLRVDPPPGWVFEPLSVDLHVDGTTDPCSTAKDIDFLFKGFSILGKVVSAGAEEGPAGVTVELQDAQGKTLQKTQSGLGGGYSFARILPGDYSLLASHPTWTLGRAKTSVKVTDDNGIPAEHLVVAGYDVRGEVFGEGEPIRGVHFVLVSEEGKGGKASPPPALEGCEAAVPRGFALPPGVRFLCQVTSGEDGQFVFPAVPPGSYRLLPFYKAQRIEFDIAPRHASFALSHAGHRFPKRFQVQGFSVSGKVRVSEGGPGVAQAEVFLGSSRVATTDTTGTFHLENMKAGQYVLHIKAPGMAFDPFPVRVSPSTPELPAVLAAQFEVCGSIEGAGRRIVIEGGREPSTVVADSAGRFCTSLRPGRYVLRPFVGREEEAAGLRFQPSELPLEVPAPRGSPAAEPAFTRFRAEVRGRVSCLRGECGSGLRVSLRGEGGAESLSAEVQPDGSFHFAGLVVGQYRLWVDRPEWCWEHDKGGRPHTVDTAVSSVTLRQTGFRATLVSSHATRVEALHPEDGALNLEVPKGSSQHCLPKRGLYTVRPVGCHEFREKDLHFDTARPSIVTLTVARLSVGGVVITEENVTDLVLTATISGGSGPIKVVPSAPVKHAGDRFLYRFSLMLVPGASVELVPRSARLLFSPPVLRVAAGDECAEEAARLEGRIGLFVDGRVNPPLGGVRVVVRDLAGRQPQVETESDAAGRFLVGPLDSESKYDVQATKEGYVLRALDKLGHFEAFKYAEVRVSVTGGEKGEPLPGVLVSLSGAADYRNHSRTREDGRLHFPDLSPGNYFLRPMMKEYRFSPASKMLTVGEGAVLDVSIAGERVAFSCLGWTTSVTGEAEPGVSLEALGAGACAGHQEEAVSDQEGRFRLRGLLPNCAYRLQLKPGAANPHIERAEPPLRHLSVVNSDLTDVRVIVFRYFNQMDITGRVVTDAKHLANLKVRVTADDAPEQTLHTIPLGPGGFFLLPPMTRDGRTYCLQLEGGGAGGGGTCFRANASHRHVTLRHAPELPPHPEHEVAPRSSLLALPLAVAVLLAGYHSSRLLALGADLARALRSLLRQLGGGRGVAGGEASGSPQDTRRSKAKARRT